MTDDAPQTDSTETGGRPARAHTPPEDPPDEAARCPAELHASRRDRFTARRDRAARRAGWLASARVAVFLLSLALGVVAERAHGSLALGAATAALAGLVAFGVLVRSHRRARRSERWHDELRTLQAEALARQSRRWDDLPDPGAAPVGLDHPYAADLDVFGAVSLRALFSTVATAPGRRTLDRWLATPAAPREVRRRQEAIRELAGALDTRDRLAAHGRLAGDPSAAALDAFARWCGAPDRTADRPWLVWSARLLPPATVSLILAHLVGLVDRAWWLLPLAAAVAVTALVGSELEDVMDRAETREAEFARFARMLELVAELPGPGRLLSELRGTVAGGTRTEQGSAAEELGRLDRILGFADVRHNDLVHVPFQLLFLWDVHVVRALNRWRHRTGHRVEGWLEALGRAEALAALAALRHDHPGWTLPDVDPGARSLEARALEHPLLPPERSVPNDVVVGPPGTFLLVTGSNMSGKSTLLRALGLATVLARAGGPVPARRLRLPPLRVHTSMRVQDSVARGVSTYMAELERLRDVVDTARSPTPETGNGASAPEGRVEGRGEAGEEKDGPRGSPHLLYLLDEPLQGTNEAERREALRTVLRHLLRAGSIGAVATHDLRLHRVEDLGVAARPVHFSGSVREVDGAPELAFDYRLREGPATSTNALELLEIVGLGPGPGSRPDGGAE